VGFVWDGERRRAVDHRREISIHKAYVCEDSYPFFTFQYDSPQLAFKFVVVFHNELRTYFRKGESCEASLPVSVDIIEPWLKTALRQAKVDFTSAEQYGELKATLREGMIVCGAPRYLDGVPIIPEFQAKFVSETPKAF
jgi:hypothetical protein